jgi:chromate transporter
MSNAPPSLGRLAWEFSRIGLTSFGGGVSGWLMRVVVNERHWMDQEEFLNGLSLSQALPGVNVKNMAIWVGYRLLGARGAAAGFFGIIVPPAVFILVLGAAFGALIHVRLVQLALDGATAAAIGLSLAMGLTAGLRVPRRLFPLLVMAAVFAAIGLLHWPLIPVVLAAAAVSVGATWRDLARR